jgi:hypothetical protein
MLERDIIWMAHDVWIEGRNVETMDGYVDGRRNGREGVDHETQDQH